MRLAFGKREEFPVTPSTCEARMIDKSTANITRYVEPAFGLELRIKVSVCRVWGSELSVRALR